ncbi:hypothetical protein EWB00_008529 [Schistosoma japonicum]|uniref:Uncharacterized protein n=1 Tax=Schistosoma japonicum TaxID=6182 RepID=A0A4Z2CQC6_SCHJA|nr:hypothetical protein EWB00_008529 [Schistosoma japonicum]
METLESPSSLIALYSFAKSVQMRIDEHMFSRKKNPRVTRTNSPEKVCDSEESTIEVNPFYKTPFNVIVSGEYDEDVNNADECLPLNSLKGLGIISETSQVDGYHLFRTYSLAICFAREQATMFLKQAKLTDCKVG